VQPADPRKVRFESRHRLREGVAQPGNQLKQRQVTITEAASDVIAITSRILLEHPLEVAKVFRDAVRDEISGAPLSFGALILVIEARGDRVMGVVRLVDDIGNRQLQLIRPQPTGFVARREAESPAEVKQDIFKSALSPARMSSA